ncbi:MAG: hypothetical protein JNJ48_03565 [Phycisphaerae bacterium]|nr:hypothetical protein [Phycisphaerae bacterium]
MTDAAGQYGWGGVRVEVRSEAPGIPPWLDEFLLPWFAPEPLARECWTIEVRCSAEAAARSHGEPLGDIDVFSRDQGAERLAAWRTDGAVVLADARSPTRLSVRTAQRQVVVTIERDAARPRSLVMRLVREILCTHAAEEGWAMLHASAAAVGNSAAVFLGGKGSGKTTLLMRALVGGAGLVANDRVLARAGADGPRIHGCPTIVRIRPDTSARVPGLRGADSGNAHRYYLTLAECRAECPLREPTDREPPSMSPAQFTEWTRAGRMTAARPAALVFPRVCADTRSFRLQPLGAQDALDLLSRCAIEPASNGLFSPVARGPNPTDVTALADTVPSWLLELGPGAYGPEGAWDAVVRLLAAR